MLSITINAHLLSATAGYRSAGIHGYIYNTLLALPQVAPNYHFDVLVGQGNPPTASNLNVHRTSLPTERPEMRIFWEQFLQPRQIQHLKPDVYHGMAFVAPSGLSAPSVVTVYDLTFMRYPDALSRARRLYLQRFTKASCERAAQVIAISESTAKDLHDLLDIPRDKITVALPGIGAQYHLIPPEIIAKFRKDKNLPERFILHVGTLEPRKNLPMLLRAYALLPLSLRRAAPLVFVGGKGWGYDEIFSTIDYYNLDKFVHFIGFVDGAELPLWYNAAELFVYPSVFEGWGMPVTEAMACGCPTFVSDVSSLPEAAGNTGKRLPVDDEGAWADALEDVLTDHTWRHISSEASMARAKQFTWDKTAEAHLDAYQAARR